jgi:hypothetical protein
MSAFNQTLKNKINSPILLAKNFISLSLIKCLRLLSKKQITF